MAYSGGSYSGPTAVLDSIHTLALAEGWTVNQYSAEGTGYRLHMVSPNGVYCNLRSGVSEDMFGGTGVSFTGIGVNASTGYNASNDWDDQPGIGSLSGYGGCLPYMISGDVGEYMVIIQDDYVFCAAETTCQQLMSQFCIGNTTLGTPMYSASFSSSSIPGSTTTDNYAAFMCNPQSSYGQNRSSSVYMGTDWTQNTSGLGSLNRPLDTDAASSSYSMSQTLCYQSSNQLKGNILLIPSYFSYNTTSTSTYSTYAGHVEGITVLNAGHLVNGDIITQGSDEYYIINPCVLNDTPSARVAIKR